MYYSFLNHGELNNKSSEIPLSFSYQLPTPPMTLNVFGFIMEMIDYMNNKVVFCFLLKSYLIFFIN